jgi:hypothetical protein
VVLPTSRKQASTFRYHRIRTSVGNANKRSVNLSLPPPSPFSHGADFIQAAVFGPSNYSAARSSSSNQKQRSTPFSSTSFFMTWRRRRSGTKQTSFHIIGHGVFGINAISIMHFLSTLGRNTLHKESRWWRFIDHIMLKSRACCTKRLPFLPQIPPISSPSFLYVSFSQLSFSQTSFSQMCTFTGPFASSGFTLICNSCEKMDIQV